MRQHAPFRQPRASDSIDVEDGATFDTTWQTAVLSNRGQRRQRRLCLFQDSKSTFLRLLLKVKWITAFPSLSHLST